MSADDTPPPDELPHTVDQAVAFVLARLSDEQRVQLRNISDDPQWVRVRLAAQMGYGMWARALLGLWRGEAPRLLQALPHNERHPDSASNVILCECWRRLYNGECEPFCLHAYVSDEADAPAIAEWRRDPHDRRRMLLLRLLDLEEFADDPQPRAVCQTSRERLEIILRELWMWERYCGGVRPEIRFVEACLRALPADQASVCVVRLRP